MEENLGGWGKSPEPLELHRIRGDEGRKGGGEQAMKPDPLFTC